MEVRREYTSVNHGLGHKEVVKRSEFFPDDQAPLATRLEATIQYIVGIVCALLAIRFALQLFGAGQTEFVRFIYYLTDPLVFPFRGMFPSPTGELGRFDTASVVAIIVYILLGPA